MHGGASINKWSEKEKAENKMRIVKSKPLSENEEQWQKGVGHKK